MTVNDLRGLCDAAQCGERPLDTRARLRWRRAFPPELCRALVEQHELLLTLFANAKDKKAREALRQKVDEVSGLVRRADLPVIPW